MADITQKPAQAELTLKTQSSITAAMSLLDEPPFGFLTKAGYPVSVAEGHAAMVARLNLPFLGELPLSIDVRLAGDAGTPIAAGQGSQADAYARLAARLVAGGVA